MKQQLTIVHQDEWLVAVIKPDKMFVHRSDGWDQNLLPLMQRVRNQLGRPVFTVHRLDRATSGLIVLALSHEIAADLSLQFRERQVTKQYQALVRGFCDDAGTIDLPMARKGNSRPHPESGPALLECCTDYVTTARFELPMASGRYETTRCSLVTVTPRTGRWHQIRRHLNRIAHPILGDTTHGDNTQNRFFRETFGLDRLMLAATGLQFCHPATSEMLKLETPPDTSFLKLTGQIECYRQPV
jgi:tRNA pseudouridine65 synthase